LHVQGLDQTGLSQKAGPVTSHLRLSTGPIASSNRVSPATADCLLAFDLLTAADAKNLRYAHSSRTVAVASTSRTATGAMVADPQVTHPDDHALLDRLSVSTRDLLSFDALAAAETLFGSTAAANFLLVGAAVQLGALPVPASFVERAIELNGVAVATNVAAFRWGRAAVCAPEAFSEATTPHAAESRTIPALPAVVGSRITVAEPLRPLVERRAAELVAYQSRTVAAEYIDVVEAVWAAERRRAPARSSARQSPRACSN
jgi:indolepyruvate ferredoxin oxidoreductase